MGGALGKDRGCGSACCRGGRRKNRLQVCAECTFYRHAGITVRRRERGSSGERGRGREGVKRGWERGSAEREDEEGTGAGS
jgi:hypothetical protein